ncbi:hypothetical protein C8R45DRAFT_937035 [Mycena sanguinolenta]|nr:hypothetical protein C8R45DRAFT_937035 [Mycena sanguinolenta]
MYSSATADNDGGIPISQQFQLSQSTFIQGTSAAVVKELMRLGGNENTLCGDKPQFAPSAVGCRCRRMYFTAVNINIICAPMHIFEAIESVAIESNKGGCLPIDKDNFGIVCERMKNRAQKMITNNGVCGSKAAGCRSQSERRWSFDLKDALLRRIIHLYRLCEKYASNGGPGHQIDLADCTIFRGVLPHASSAPDVIYVQLRLCDAVEENVPSTGSELFRIERREVQRGTECAVLNQRNPQLLRQGDTTDRLVEPEIEAKDAEQDILPQNVKLHEARMAVGNKCSRRAQPNT